MKPFWTPCPVLFMALYFKRSPGEKDFCALMNFKYPDSTAKGWHKELYSRSRRATEGDRSLPDSYSWHPAGLGSRAGSSLQKRWMFSPWWPRAGCLGDRASRQSSEGFLEEEPPRPRWKAWLPFGSKGKGVFLGSIARIFL